MCKNKTVKTEAHSEHCQTSNMELFTKLVNGLPPLTILAISSILDVRHGFYASTILYILDRVLNTPPIYINTFTVKGFSETRPFMHLSKHVFGSQ